VAIEVDSFVDGFSVRLSLLRRRRANQTQNAKQQINTQTMATPIKINGTNDNPNRMLEF
jgi:hypothetical protein